MDRVRSEKEKGPASVVTKKADRMQCRHDEKGRTYTRRLCVVGGTEDEGGRRNHRGSSSEPENWRTKGSWWAVDGWRSTREGVGEGVVKGRMEPEGMGCGKNVLGDGRKGEGGRRQGSQEQYGSLSFAAKKQKEANAKIWEIHEDAEKI